jgi:hypothetical protein
MDGQGKVSVWDTTNNLVRLLDFGKFQTTCIAVASHQKDTALAGAKGGQIYLLHTVGEFENPEITGYVCYS